MEKHLPSQPSNSSANELGQEGFFYKSYLSGQYLFIFPSDVSFLVFFSSFGKEKRKESKRQKERWARRLSALWFLW